MTTHASCLMQVKKFDDDDEPKPIIIHFKTVLKGLAVGASLLPSLRAQYQVRHCLLLT